MSFLDKQITIRLALEFLFLNGAIFIPLFAFVSKFMKPLARGVTASKIRRYDKLLKQAQEDFGKGKLAFDGADWLFFKFSLGILLLDLLSKLV